DVGGAALALELIVRLLHAGIDDVDHRPFAARGTCGVPVEHVVGAVEVPQHVLGERVAAADELFVDDVVADGDVARPAPRRGPLQNRQEQSGGDHGASVTCCASGRRAAILGSGASCTMATFPPAYAGSGLKMRDGVETMIDSSSCGVRFGFSESSSAAK